jgi:hypothetical protein
MGKRHLANDGAALCGNLSPHLTAVPLDVTCKGCKAAILRTAILEAEALRGTLDKPTAQLALEMSDVEAALARSTASNAKMRKALQRIAKGVRAPHNYARSTLDKVANTE